MNENANGPDPRDKWSVFHFAISNPAGPDQGNVSRLLRVAADHLEELGDVQVNDITFSSEPTENEDDLSLTIYYDRKPRRRGFS
jgi:hypothetical protein